MTHLDVTTDGLEAHARLLLLLGRPTVPAADLEEARRLVDGGAVDWGAFVEASARHKLLPLVARNLVDGRLDRGDRGDGSNGIPFAWLYPYAYLANRSRNQTTSDEVRRVVSELSRAGVRHAVRKGFVLAEEFYSDTGARRINDLDLLVARSDAPRVHDVLTSLGYAQGRIARDADVVEPFSRATQVFWRTNLGNQLPYVRLGGQMDVPVHNVDLCHEIFQPNLGIACATEDLLDRARPVRLCGTDTWRLGDVDLLLDLCAHLHKEATGLLFVEGGTDLQVSKFLDLAVVGAATDAPTWDAFVARVTELGADEVVFYALWFTARLYPAAVPGHVLGSLRPADTSYLDVGGDRDGHPTTWSVPFPERLFSGPRVAAPSLVPHR